MIGRLEIGSVNKLLVASVAILFLTLLSGCGRDAPAPAGAIGVDDITGTVTGPAGPEAGVWVIVETTDLGTNFSKTVVTDDQGRYLIPDLPSATYDIWVRGYGLVDSEKRRAAPGTVQDLTAVIAPDAQAAAQYYPAGYWLSLIEVPDKSAFPGTGPSGNGISPNIPHQQAWLRRLKSGGCTACHALGNKATREVPSELGDFSSTVAAWERRVQSGQAGGSMVNGLNRMGHASYEMFADWTDRITGGELPPAPPRPEGVERNVVITQWDWADPKAYLHDEISTDKRDPTVNPYGPIYGALEASADYTPVLDPGDHAVRQIPVPVRDPNTPVASGEPRMPSPYWGDEAIWDSRANVHNPMLDHLGRLWLTSRVRAPDTPAFCREGSDHPSAQLFPTTRTGRNLAMYDPATEDFTLVDTCYSTHHLIFAEDDDHTLWTSGGGQVIGWLNTRMLEETGDEAASQGWSPLILDTNGNGGRDEWVEPDDTRDATKDTRITSGYYGVAYNPIDGSIWGTSLGFPGGFVRFDPTTGLTEFYETPWNAPDVAHNGYSPRGGDIDRNGVMWGALSSGHMASFDRNRCTGPLNGPTATGAHCPEGWTLYPEPLPQLKGVTDSGSAEGSYYTWVDQFNTLGLGEGVPINTGNASEGLLALVDEEWVVLRVPYPLGFYTKWMDGRIDDPEGGWKGRGIWATYGTRAPFHLETGKGTPSKVLHFQVRPDPLAG